MLPETHNPQPMKHNIIQELNRVLGNTLDYKGVLQKLANSISDRSTCDKLKEFAEVADKESENLIRLINDLGGKGSGIGHEEEDLRWVPRPLPDPNNMQAVLACLIQAERHKEQDYNLIQSHEDMKREDINRLDMHRKEAEANLRYFQSAQASLEHKIE